jgi:hypothetical protein
VSTMLEPVIYGGGLERGLRAATANVALIAETQNRCPARNGPAAGAGRDQTHAMVNLLPRSVPVRLRSCGGSPMAALAA